jgi:Phasin protein
MQTDNNPILESYQQQMDASRHIAEVVFDGTDRMEHLVLDAARKAFEDRMKFYQSLSTVRDPQGVAALQAEYFSHTPEHLFRVQQEWMHIVTESQEKISKTLQHYKAGLNGDGASRPMTVDSDSASDTTSALTSMFSMWDKAFKDTVAIATNGMASALAASTKNDDVVDVVQKPVRPKKARAR